MDWDQLYVKHPEFCIKEVAEEVAEEKLESIILNTKEYLILEAIPLHIGFMLAKNPNN